MRILHIGPSIDPSKSLGGIVTVVNIILSNKAFDFSYFSRDLGQRFKFFIFFKHLFRFVCGLVGNRFKYAHFHLSFDLGSALRDVTFFIVSKFFGVKCLFHMHGGNYLFSDKSSFVLWFLLDVSEKIIVLSPLERDFLTSRYRIDPRKIFVLENCIDFSLIPSPRFHINDKIDIIFFGRIHRSKGILDIIEVFKSLGVGFDNFTFSVFGSGPDQELFLDSLNALIPSNLHYGGLVWGDKKWEALAKADILLLPSRYGEGLPMALLESMALGIIPIVTSDGSMATVVEDQVNGFIVEKGDIRGIANAILAIDKNRDTFSKIKKNAYTTILERYSSDQYFRKLLTIYQTV